MQGIGDQLTPAKAECDFDATGEALRRCRRCGYVAKTSRPPQQIHRRCPLGGNDFPQSEIDRRGAVCRAPCPHYRAENLREWCVLDERTDENRKRCNRNAIAAFPLRILGKVGCREGCPLDKGE